MAERRLIPRCLPTLFLGALAVPALGQVLREQRVSTNDGGLSAVIGNGAQFGRSVSSVGDFDGDGIGDIAVGQPYGGPLGHGEVKIVLLNRDGTVKSSEAILHTTGSTLFGYAVEALGDMDGDGVVDLAIGYPDDRAVQIVFLNPDATVKARTVIRDTDVGGSHGYGFGWELSCLGDVDGDGIVDLAICGTYGTGCVWVVFLQSDGSARSSVWIRSGSGGFDGELDNSDSFGHGCAGIGDLDGDGVPDLAVGARGDDDRGTAAGALWILFLRSTGRVKSWTKIVEGSAGFHGDVTALDAFGAGVANLGDLDGDGIVEIGVSTFAEDDGGSGRGAFYILHMRADGTVKAQHKISALYGGFRGRLADGDAFGFDIAAIDDLDGDGTREIAVGALGTDYHTYFGGGAVWILFMDGLALSSTAEHRNAGSNPDSYRAWGPYAGAPVMGTELTLSLDIASTNHRRGVIVGYLGRANEVLPDGQVLLVDTLHPAGEILGLIAYGLPSYWVVMIPQDSSLCGVTLSTQGIHMPRTGRFLVDGAGAPTHPTTIALSNAIDFTFCSTR